MIPHGKLMKILERRIKCTKTLALLHSLMKAGFIDMGSITKNLEEGTPQGSVLSPLLCNIFMHEFDIFMANFKKEFDVGSTRRMSPEYKQLTHSLSRARAEKDIDPYKIRAIRSRMQGLPVADPMDPNYKRCTYIRFADDFIIGVIGSKTDADNILAKVHKFLGEELGLDLNLNKTKLTHFPSDKVRFLGADLKGCRHLKGTFVTKHRQESRNRFFSNPLNYRIEAPMKKLLDRLTAAGFFRRKAANYHPSRVGRVYNLDMPDIIKYYNSVIRGTLNYYSFADNRSSLGMIAHGLKHSCALTLKGKFKVASRAAIFKQFGPLLTHTEVVKNQNGVMSEKKISLYLPKDYKRLPCAKKRRFKAKDGNISLPNLHRG
jgi:hypothetical protein